ncbi:MAG TPA: glutamate-5-semialdehyde dehydrogenase [Sphaerochaeta sp.]|nr:glutamate-5-semialdehyde dehydrogenase [Sphaerochaeta sp.]
MQNVERREEIARLAKSARRLGFSSTVDRNTLLVRISEGLQRDWPAISAANEADIAAAEADKLAPALIKRLRYDEIKHAETLAGVADVIALKDPVGATRAHRLLDDGLVLKQITVPIGVIGMIFEARPDALVQIVALAAKSGNGIILKGGSEAQRTNAALVASMQKSLQGCALGSEWLLLLESRSDVAEILEMDRYIDLLIPRGSNEFVRYIMENTHIPVLGHADGICHLYIDKEADLTQALRVAYDAKTQYPAACNAIETLLVHEAVAKDFLPALSERFAESVVLHGDAQTAAFIPCVPYKDGDWEHEYLDLELNIRIVASLREAIDHINRWGSSHTDAIISTDEQAIATFFAQVDSADVFANCSTRFADGFRFGLGAEVGISTQKIHARGPVGLEGLLSTKYLLAGSGQVVGDYSGPDAKAFKHIELDPKESPDA